MLLSGRLAAIFVDVARFSVIAALVSPLAAVPSAADGAAGANCAKGLTPPASLIYADTAPDIGKNETLRELLTEHVKPMVMAGKIELAVARPAAEAAGACLDALRR